MDLKTIRKRKSFENVRGKSTHLNQAPRVVNVSIITFMYSYPYLVFINGPKKSMDISSSGSFGFTDSWIIIDAIVEILFL